MSGMTRRFTFLINSMNEILALLKPRLWSFKNGGTSKDAKNRKSKVFLFGAVGLTFWAGIFAIFYRVLVYFQGVEGFGDILARKLLSMVLLTLFSLLIFSSIITVLTKLYLSKDLVLVHSLPVSAEKIFLARWFESTIDSSWMVIVYSLPVFLSYGIVYKAGFFFYATVCLTIVPLCLIASCISALAVVLVAVILPAGRLRTVFVFLGFVLFLILIFAFRLMRPERLVNPDAFSSLVLYFRSLETPGSPFLPTTWIFDSIHGAMTGSMGSALFDLVLAWVCAGSLIFVATWISGSAYFSGFSKAQTTPERLFAKRGKRKSGWEYVLNFLSGPSRAYAVKEIKTFLRDQTQWPQLFLIIALIVVYLYNFSVLPLGKSPIRTVYLQNIFSFLNMGLATFVLTAVAARFVYPAVSIEGEAFWIVRSSPIQIRSFLWIKFFIYYIPLLILTETLIVASNMLLHVTPFMMALSVTTVFFMVPGIVSMGIGFGAAYPDFKSENPAQSVTSFGGLLFMILCAGFIAVVIILEAGPVYSVFMADFRGVSLTALQWIWLIGSFSLVLVLCILAVVLPMRWGERRLGVT
jgi:ABC-2 type transport system permease protein